MTARRSKRPSGVVVVFDGRDVILSLDGVKIAKRGHAGTPYAKTWISLEPGFTVVDTPDLTAIDIMYNPTGRGVS
jgi:hypothetical protein